MNLRTLKKLSKRAAPLLPIFGDARQQFPAKKWDNYHEAFIGERKHWERGRCHPTYEGRNDWGSSRGAEIVFTTRKGRHVVMKPPSHPRKGTMMVGSVSGYYEPEWGEQDAWSALDEIVRSHFDVWSDDGEFLGLSRTLNTPTQIFAAAKEVISARTKARAKP